MWLLLEPYCDGTGALHLVDQLDPDLGVPLRRQGSLGFPEYAPAGWQDEVGSGSRFIMGVLLSKSFYVCCFTNRMIFDYFSGLTFSP